MVLDTKNMETEINEWNFSLMYADKWETNFLKVIKMLCFFEKRCYSSFALSSVQKFLKVTKMSHFLKNVKIHEFANAV